MKIMLSKALVLAVIVLFVGMNVALSTGINVENHVLKDNGKVCSATITLPLPDFTGRNLELSICRRMSVRAFDGSDVSDQELSNILWAAYGYMSNGKRTIHSVNGKYSASIYVIRRDGTYKYIPESHTLSLFRSGDYSFIGQYDTAPIKIGLVWNKGVSDDENIAMTEIGMIGQNIYFEANALNLGTVTTAQEVDQLYLLRLPVYEKPEIIMPLGHPLDPYDFTYDPLPSSNLPLVVNNSISLEDAINLRNETTIWNDEPLTSIEQSQIIWASYGYSYLIDNLNDKRHRTVPSSHGTYPMHVFAANHSGIYQYVPSSHSVVEIAQGDRRIEISETVESDGVIIQSASWILICFLDTDIGNPDYPTAWYYEAGAIAHNVFLESTALNLSTNVVDNIVDDDALRSALGLSSQTNLIPLLIMPTGRTTPSNPPDTPDLSGPTSGKTGIEYTYTTSTTDPDGDKISYGWDWEGDKVVDEWTGLFDSGETAASSHSWDIEGTYEIRVKGQKTKQSTHHSYSFWRTIHICSHCYDNCWICNRGSEKPLFFFFLFSYKNNLFLSEGIRRDND